MLQLIELKKEKTSKAEVSFSIAGKCVMRERAGEQAQKEPTKWFSLAKHSMFKRLQGNWKVFEKQTALTSAAAARV